MKKKKRIIAKKKNGVKKRRKTKKPQHLLVKLALILGVFLAITISFLYFSDSKSSVGKIAQRDSLQLQTFTPSPKPTATPTPVPPPVDACNHHDDGTPVDPSCNCAWTMVHCQNHTCTEIDLDKSGQKTRNGHDITCDDTRPPTFPNNWCQPPISGDTDGWYCLGKPVVYLYPTYPMYVDVSVLTPGTILISDPEYPTGGWKQVFAQPSGSLKYRGKTYQELFYESSIKDFGKPKNGINIPLYDLKSTLSQILTSLGLVEHEKQEFLDFWVPKIQALHAPYIQFSIIEQSEKEKVDHVEISPKPDTMIQFIAYFKGLHSPYLGPVLVLPANPPQRTGFTAVEWGGTIDYKN